MLRNLREPKLRWVLFAASLMMTVTAVLIYGALANRFTVSVLTEKTAQIEKNSLAQTASDLSDQFLEVESYLEGSMQSESLNKNLITYMQDELLAYDRLELFQRIVKEFIITKNSHENIRNAYLVLEKGTVYTVEGIPFRDAVDSVGMQMEYEILEKSCIPEKLEQTENRIVLLPKNYLDPKNGLQLQQDTFIGRIELTGAKPAFVVIAMQDNWMQSVVGSNYKDIVVADQENESLLWASSEKAQALFQAEPEIFVSDSEHTLPYQGENYRLSTVKLRYHSFYLTLIQNNSTIASSISRVQAFGLTAAVLCLLINFIISSLTAKKISHPLAQLSKTAQEYKMKKGLRRISLHRLRYSFGETVTGYLFCSVLLTLGLYHLIFWSFASTLMQETVKNSIQLSVGQTANNLSNFVRRNERITQNLMFDPSLQEYLSGDKSAGTGAEEAISHNLNWAERLYQARIYDTAWRPEFYAKPKSMEALDELQQDLAEASRGQLLFFTEYNESKNKLYLRLLRKINDVYRVSGQGTSSIGYLEFLYDFSELGQVYVDPVTEGSKAELVSEDGRNLLSHNGSASQLINFKLGSTGESFLEEVDGKTYFTTYTACAGAPWTYVLSIPASYLTKDSHALLLYGFSILFWVAAASYATARLLSSLLKKPIINLILQVRGEDGGERVGDLQKNQLCELPINELNALELAFNDMIGRVDRVVELEKQRNRAELTALQCQINPHFLYNSFELIKWLSAAGEVGKVELMTDNLTQLFRLGINEKKTFITVEEEIGYTEAYLNIQRMRYEDILEIQWDVDPKTLELLVPKLLLQPLVENSIYHGIRELENSMGTLRLSAHVENGFLVFRICDNGAGFLPDQLLLIRQKLKNLELEAESIGLFNVNKRLRLFYGNRYHIELESIPQMCTSVILWIPL